MLQASNTDCTVIGLASKVVRTMAGKGGEMPMAVAVVEGPASIGLEGAWDDGRPAPDAATLRAAFTCSTPLARYNLL